MKNPLLLMHLLGALLFAISVLVAILSIFIRRVSVSFYKKESILLAVQTCIQFFTGSLLVFQQGVISSPLVLCRNIAIYLLIVIAVEIALFEKISKSGELAPKLQVASLIGVGLVSIISAFIIL